nr:MADS-box transcription factor [Spirodela polyrhiza]
MPALSSSSLASAASSQLSCIASVRYSSSTTSLLWPCCRTGPLPRWRLRAPPTATAAPPGSPASCGTSCAWARRSTKSRNRSTTVSTSGSPREKSLSPGDCTRTADSVPQSAESSHTFLNRPCRLFEKLT